jgi:2,4-dienoyl-CoA reductase-like NADH-dependent reductase (Old Yellow Enzyme family)
MDEFLNFKLKENVILKNRFVLAPMTTYSVNEDLTLSDQEEIYYRERGREFGMVITAATAVSKHAQAFVRQISAMNVSYLPSLTRLAKAIKENGSYAILQLHHGGRMNALGLYDNQDIVSASAVKANRVNVATPRELKTHEVYQIIEDFRQAMILAIKAGFDGIELHGANTYLIQQFFSPNSNLRNDEFGGTLLKRLAFPLKLVQMAIETREEYASSDFIIGYRLSPEEIEEPGITLRDTEVLVAELSKQDIDYINLSLSSYKQKSIRDKTNPDMIIKTLKKSNIGRKPFIGVGGIDDFAKAKEAVSLGFDLLAIGTAALADTKVVSNILSKQEIKRVIDKDSLLPEMMKDRIKQWSYLLDRGYQVK